MMYKIFESLKENIKKIYNGNNIITIYKLLHHSLNFPEMLELYKKYKGNSKKFQEELYDHINQYELGSKRKSPSRSKKGVRHFELDGSIFNEDFFDEQFPGLYHKHEYDPNQIYEDQDVLALFELAQRYELVKIQRTAQETGQVVQPADISLGSFLRAVIDFSQSSQKYAFLNKLMKDTGFDIEKFVKDDDLGRSKNKKVISDYCTNLNKKAKLGKIQPVIGRDIEIEQLENILKKAKKNNPILVGRAGVGKTAIVEGLAKRIVEGKVPEALKNAQIYELRVMDMVKGTSFRGVFEQRMSDLLEEFKDLEEGGELPILFIDELHTIMGAGGQGGLDFSNIIKPALARGELRTIGATTTDEWYKFIKDNPALDRRFISISIKEPSDEDTLKILEGSLPYYEKAHNVKYDKGTLERAIELGRQFIVDNAFPDKAFDLIDYAGAMCVVKEKKRVEIEDIEQALARNKNIDLVSITQTRKNQLEPLAPKLKLKLFGQDSAVDKVARTVEKALAGLNAKDKPYGAFLFSGPTGTGKTELAKQLALAMNANFYRLDMSEFQEAHSVAKLIGSPAGYIGYDDSSSITKIINENPRTVLLLDEIEKAHPDVYKIFLQVMDYGKLTDSKGREINFRNVLLIMTTNAGSRTGKKGIGINNSVDNSVDQDALNRTFPAEFRGRLTGNGAIQFNPLTKEILEKIVDKYIGEVHQDRLDKLKIKLTLSADVKSKLVDLGLSKNLGARPVKDYIENELIEPLTDLILFGALRGLKKEKEVLALLKEGKIVLKIED